MGGGTQPGVNSHMTAILTPTVLARVPPHVEVIVKASTVNALTGGQRSLSISIHASTHSTIHPCIMVPTLYPTVS